MTLTTIITADATGQWVVLAETDDQDTMQCSGRWIKASELTEVER